MTDDVEKSFEVMKQRVTNALILSLPNFQKVFEVECDASNIGIGVVLSQDNKSIAFYSEKLNDSRRKYLVYDKEFHAIICTMDNWCQYLCPKPFVLYSDHEGLKFLNSQ